MEDEEKQVPEVNEAQAEGDNPSGEQASEQQPVSGIKALLGKYKKYLVPAVIGLTALIVSLVIPQFFNSDKEPQAEAAAEHGADTLQTVEENRDSLLAEAARPLELSELDDQELEELLSMNQLYESLDTDAILKEMDAMDNQAPEKLVDGEQISAADSVDTLNWIDKEMQKLTAEKDSLKNLKEELQTLNQKVEKASDRLDKAESARLTKLARLYDGMKADEVARLFDNLPDSVIIMILPKMKPANAAKILGLMKPKRAAGISTKLITVMEP